MEADDDLRSLHGSPRWETVLGNANRALDDYLQSNNRELFFMYKQDQDDRSIPYEEIDWDSISMRDRARRERLEEILRAGEVRSADDFFAQL